MIDPLSKSEFISHMNKSESAPSYSENAVDRFYRWMYSGQQGAVQVCAFPVPPKDTDKCDLGKGKWIHSRSYNEFEDFCRTHSGLWQYHVYSGVNALDDSPQYGRGGVGNIDRVSKLSFDIELSRESYGGSTKREVWWTYQYALAQIKYVSEKYDVWPLVVMSENGIHLHYNVEFECSDEYLYNRQHVYSKYITQDAMSNRYVDIIEQKSPDNIEFSQDDVSDPARVMKVPGTRGIKSEKGRLCGIIHQPNSDNAGVITESDIPKSVSEIKNEIDSSVNRSNGSLSSDSSTENIDVTPSDLTEDVALRVEHLIRNDPSFSGYWRGDHEEYDSRSEMEFAFIIKLLNHGFTESEIVNIMYASGMSKWNEESKHYRETTIANAIDYFDGSVTKDSTNGSFSF